MNKLSLYSRINNLEIDEPKIYDLFFPLGDDNFVLLETGSPDNKYHNWQLVFGILNPFLQKLKLNVYHCGEDGDKKIMSTNRLGGVIAPNQLSFLIKKSKLLITTNPLAAQMAASLNKDVVFVCEDSLLKKYRPSRVKSGKYKSILNNEKTKPEEIASSILSFLNISLNLEFETVFIGRKNRDGQEFIESAPNQICRFDNQNQQITIRMDLFFSEENLVKQLELTSGVVVTNKKINLEILKAFKKKVHRLVYFIEENDDPIFCKEVINLGLNTSFFSKLSNDLIQRKKLDYMDLGLIHRLGTSCSEDFKDLDPSELYYLSNRFILSNSKVYPSEAAYSLNIATSSKTKINQIINNDSFWGDLESIWMLKKKS